MLPDGTSATPPPSWSGAGSPIASSLNSPPIWRRAGRSTWRPVKDRNGLWLAGRGWTVTAVDFSEVGIAKGRRLAERLELTERLIFERADLTAYVPTPGGYDLVLIAYLHLPTAQREVVVSRAAEAVAPGGTLLIVGHDLANLERGVGGPQDPDVLYTEVRLRDAIAASGLTVASAGERLRPVDGAERPAVDTVLLARRE